MLSRNVNIVCQMFIMYNVDTTAKKFSLINFYANLQNNNLSNQSPLECNVF